MVKWGSASLSPTDEIEKQDGDGINTTHTFVWKWIY